MLGVPIIVALAVVAGSDDFGGAGATGLVLEWDVSRDLGALALAGPGYSPYDLGLLRCGWNGDLINSNLASVVYITLAGRRLRHNLRAISFQIRVLARRGSSGSRGLGRGLGAAAWGRRLCGLGGKAKGLDLARGESNASFFGACAVVAKVSEEENILSLDTVTDAEVSVGDVIE